MPRLLELAQRMEDGEFSLCFVGRAMIADPEWCPKVARGAFEELTTAYSRETLMRLAEGNHAVDVEVHGPIVMPVDEDGKPVLDVEAAEAKGKTVYWPSVRAHPQPQRVTCLCACAIQVTHTFVLPADRAVQPPVIPAQTSSSQHSGWLVVKA